MLAVDEDTSCHGTLRHDSPLTSEVALLLQQALLTYTYQL